MILIAFDVRKGNARAMIYGILIEMAKAPTKNRGREGRQCQHSCGRVDLQTYVYQVAAYQKQRKANSFHFVISFFLFHLNFLYKFLCSAKGRMRNYSWATMGVFAKNKNCMLAERKRSQLRFQLRTHHKWLQIYEAS